MLPRIADRVGSRPKRSLLLVLLFVLVAGVLGGPVAGALKDSGGFTAVDSGSQRATDRIEAATGREQSPGVVLLVSTPRGPGDPATQGRLQGLRRELGREPGIAAAATAASASDRGFSSRDGRSTLVTGTLRADAADGDVASAVRDRFGDRPGVVLGGAAVADQQVGDAVSGDLGRAETFALPILIVLSLVFFRGRRAAALPLVIGVVTVLGTFLVLRLVNLGYGLSIFALNLVIGLGLGLAIDYSLFLVTRYREELAVRGPGPEAIRATMGSAGRTVAFSAVTVAIALITLVVFPLGFLKSMGIAGAVVALMAASAALVIAPILFALWGRKLAVSSRRRGADAGAEGRWYRLSHAIMRRPGAVAVVTGAVMLAAALPALQAQWTPVDSTVIPKGQSGRTVADRLQADFAGQDTTPITVALAAPGRDRAGVQRYASSLAALDGVRGVAAPRRLDASTWQVDVDVDGRPEGDAAQRLVQDIRDQGAPFPIEVGGPPAEFVDQQDAIGSRLPLAVALLVVLTFGVLWLMTGSVVLPFKALVMNALTVGVALASVKLGFQDGRLTGLLGSTPNGGVEPTDFLVAAALVFALSTDYGVFLLGRIKEARGTAASEREAVAVGLSRTGSVVTAAAILLAVAIGAFVTSSISFIQQIGVATAVGVLVDAFVVRTFLVPSLMALLGGWNWWSPGWLRRAHGRVAFDEGPSVPAPRAGSAPQAA